MPTDVDPDMALVLVQNLAPDHKRILTDLIRRYTRMQVFEVQDGMKVKPNCAYIIMIRTKTGHDLRSTSRTPSIAASNVAWP